VIRAALTGKHDTLVRRAPGWQGALRIHLTHLSTERLGPRHGEERRAHQMLNAALHVMPTATDVPCFVVSVWSRCVFVSVYLLGTQVSRAKTAEPTEMPSG